eukprot:Selendium_serpulae@DN6364_c0_g1_i2.p1
MLHAIQYSPHPGTEASNSHVAFDVVSKVMLKAENGRRPTQPLLLVFMTNGRSPHSAAAVKAASRLNEADPLVHLYVVSMGDDGKQAKALQDLCSTNAPIGTIFSCLKCPNVVKRPEELHTAVSLLSSALTCAPPCVNDEVAAATTARRRGLGEEYGDGDGDGDG